MASVTFKNVKKDYSGTQVVKGFDLEIQDGEFVVLLGSSGCGKSTTLRMVAGLEDISSGEIFLDDVCINDVDPKDRDLAMVFQSYALYPHMSVYDNIAFSLKLKKMPRDKIDQRVEWAADLLELTPLLERKPKALSGGQRQRVAMGRAMVRTPKLFLFDEPLSNLDAKLRAQMRAEIKGLHRELETTTIYVTHDQVEAMTLADRIVIMEKGVIAQIGSPKEVFNRPVNKFVAGFIGNPSMNMIDTSVSESEGKASLALNGGSIQIPEQFDQVTAGSEVTLGIRPTDIHLKPEFVGHDNHVSVKCKLVDYELLGASMLIRAEIGDQPLSLEVPADDDFSPDEDFFTGYLDLNSIHLFDAEKGQTLRR